MYEQESAGPQSIYVYGGPRAQHGAMPAYQPEPTPAPQVATSNPGCLGFLLGLLTMGIFGIWDYRKEVLRAQVAMHQADRYTEGVYAQVGGRLRDTMYHIDNGMVPGSTIHDMDRTSGAKSLDPQEAQRGANVGMGGYRPAAGMDPFDVELGAGEYTYQEDSEL